MKRMTPDQAVTYIGVQHDGGLSPCPGMPNAVCSYFPKDRSHFLAPLLYEGSEDSARERIKAIHETLSGVRLLKEQGHYLHYEFKSLIMHYFDDVEFLIDSEAQTIHFRSASREGFWDFGRNARRMKKFKSLFQSIRV